MVFPPSGREVLSSFDFGISLADCEEEIAFWLEREGRVKRAVRHMLDGDISSSELLEICDQSVPDTDAYLDTVAENLLDFMA